MSASPDAHAYFTAHSQADGIYLLVNCIAGPAAQHIVEWLTDMGKCTKPYSIPLRSGHFLENLAVRRAALILGMSPYVAHFTKKFCDHLLTGTASYDEIAMIGNLTTDDDPLFNCLIKNLAHLRAWNGIEDFVQFEKFLSSHPELAAAIAYMEGRLVVSCEGCRKRTPLKLRRKANEMY
ncbi:uncharacterized protein BDR25DRAFT_309403 [Lindgomyces ingoldianus]|uniref:Uncharacterized protein n=1 Tax=Lindgomyces ingoldianus TaxID=673940 RepID=A0ACB6RF34_9PLEO|nr:uncharacterized protein BDR25DRAFT_309403 [Lindgomyces ingoldianus]KAF2477102.1 hypothetical protein BDR25DRAFT_309403 [Lindgomyces ingoldianus]